MERTKKIKEEPVVAVEETKPILLTWQKVGGGSLRWKNRIIKPGETFQAAVEDLPKAFMDTLVCLDKEGLKKVETAIVKETHVIENLFSLKKSKTSKSHWDVVNAEGKPINEKPLEKGSAEELLAAVNG